ncbi:ABC transporter substrate-binding protein [Pseudodesulfovibrio sediminis]|uniref:Thiamine biosynthesis protein n=1 Tax=Pseudodesulfovibrio sediminis TaxID=2810563 RepID=A0ABM7P4C1_9BACT|nr:ABC transporter substrate-binding protein [Pseudodesulfovibrio sediminis]BCS87686.1 thiamine biosynthesis protein [Pseudodesulfovibrio sediminis]
MKKIVLTALCLLVFSLPVHAENMTIRFGVLPVIDSLPLHVASRDGLFEKHGLNVELVKFMSALERDTAIQTGQLDGAFGDLIATYMLINQGVPMRIALTSWRTTPGYPMFGIALSPACKDRDLGDMKGRKLGLSKSTIMEYLADKMEDHLKVNRGHFVPVEIKKVPIRMQMLMTDQIDSALLPEPLLTLTRLKGGGILTTAENLDMPLTVLFLNAKYYEDGGKGYTQFVAAYKEAVQRLAENPEAYRSLMAETCRIPPPLVSKFPIYPFPMPKLPTAAELDDVQEWMMAKGLLKKKISNETALSPIKP